MSKIMTELEKDVKVDKKPQPLPAKEQVSFEKIDAVLSNSIKSNAALGVVSYEFAADPDLKNSPAFNFRRKLILAEFLRLIADHLDPEKGKNMTLANLRAARQKIKESIEAGVGQMLRRLRPREILANQIILWKANSTRAKDKVLPRNHTSIIIGPNKLNSRGFQKVVDHELKSTNDHIADGEYRSFMFLPLDKYRGGTMALLPYMRMARKWHMLIVGSLPVGNSRDTVEAVCRQWAFNINDVEPEEYEVLSHAAIVLNNLVIREPYRNYHESEPLSAGMEYAFAAQMTKYFQRKKVGHWYIPIMHPRIKAKEMRTVNSVDTLEDWQACVNKHMNFAYTTTESQDKVEPGVRVYGGTTPFPEEAVDLEQIGNQAVPLIQAQARAVKNRIFFKLRTELEKLIGGQYDEDDVKKRVRQYLDGMFLKKQIYGFEILDVSKSETGVFRIKVEIRWSPTAEEFIIDTSGKDNQRKEEN